MDPGSKVSNVSGFWPCIGITTLNVNNALTNSRGFVGKSLLIPAIKPPNQNQMTGCDLQSSVPSTPVSDCEEIDDYTSNYTALDMDTREIIDNFFLQFTGLSYSKNVNKQVMATMKRVVESLIVKHEITYKGMINRLELDEKEDDMRFITAVAKELFDDGITNWGRISSLLAFGAMLCKYLNDRGRSQCVRLVAEQISSYLLSAQRDWLLRNKAWDGFVDFFHVPDPEAAVRNTLMAIGSMATFGAALAYWIRPSVGSIEDYGNETHRASPDPPVHYSSTCCGYLSQAQGC